MMCQCPSTPRRIRDGMKGFRRRKSTLARRYFLVALDQFFGDEFFSVLVGGGWIGE